LRGKRGENGCEIITHSFLLNTLNKEDEDLRTDDEKKINMHVIFLDKETALHRMELQKKSVEAGVYKEHYNTNFNVLRDYEIFKEFIKS
jgi:hypothetical protein